MSYKERIENKLRARFSPEILEVRDDSAKHAGHAGARPEGETHFFVHIKAADFAGQSRVARQRMVYEVLREELDEHVHALSLKVEG